MKTSVVLISVGLVVAALIVLFLGGPDRDYTTDSAEAYALFEAGEAHLMAFQFSEANAALTEAVELDPGFAAAHALLAQARYRVGQRESALASAALADSLQRSLPNKLERAKIELTLSGLMEKSRAARDSLISYILAEQPNDVQALSALATFQSAENVAAAESTYARLLTIEPNNAPAYNMLGYLAAARGEYDSALAHLRKYAFLAPGLANPHDSLGEVLAWTGQYAEAESEFETSVRIQPDFYYSSINLGEVWMEQGEITRGLEQLARVRPDVLGTDYEQMIDEIIIRMLYHHELYEASLAAIDDYVDRKPDAFASDYYRAIALSARGQREEAAATVGAFLIRVRGKGYPETKMYRNIVENMELSYHAYVAQMDGDWDTAAGNLSQILVLSADEPPHQTWRTRYRIAEARFKQGRAEEALTEASRALAHNPNLIQPLMLAATAAQAAGNETVTRKALQHLGPLLTKADSDLPIQGRYRSLQDRLGAR